MPVKVKRQGEKYRVIEASTGRLALSSGGIPRDGGGHESEEKAKAQANAINASLSEDKI